MHDLNSSEAIREANRQERIALKLHPKSGGQSLKDQRAALMTWSKASLVEFSIRDESESIFAHDRAIAAEQALRENRMESITADKPKHKRAGYDKARSFAWKLWRQPRRGQDFDAETVFAAGWEAAKAEIAQSVAQYRAVWPGGSVSAALPSPLPLIEAAAEDGVAVVIEKRMTHYGAWKEQTNG